MKRDSFVFRGEWKDAIMGLPDAVRLEIYEAIIEYGTSGTIPTLKPTAMMAFNFTKMAIDRDRERYEERSEKARLSASARWNRDMRTDAIDANACERSERMQTQRTHANDANAENAMRTDANGCYNVLVLDNDNKEKVSKETKKKFSPPSVDDVAALCKERGYTASNPSAFVAYYESNGWRVGKNPMKSWESALAGWEVREKERGKVAKPTEIGRTDFSHDYSKPW